MSLPQAEFWVQARPILGWPPAPSAIFTGPHLFQGRTALATQRIAAPSISSLVFLQSNMNWQTADPAFGNYLVPTNKDYLFMRNTSVSLTLTVKLRSFPEPIFGRMGDFPVVLPPGIGAVLGPITRLGWMQSDGNIYIDAPTSDIQFLPMVFS